MRTFDDWKCTPPEDDHMTTKDVAELQDVRASLKEAVRSLMRAKRAADLPTGRRSRITSAETEIYDIMADIDEELSQC